MTRLRARNADKERRRELAGADLGKPPVQP
jgi:hypothetical protein